MTIQKMKNYIKVKKISTFWKIQIAISLDWKKINAFCLCYTIMHLLGLQDIIMDNVISKDHFFEMSPCVPTVASVIIVKKIFLLNILIIVKEAKNLNQY